MTTIAENMTASQCQTRSSTKERDLSPTSSESLFSALILEAQSRGEMEELEEEGEKRGHDTSPYKSETQG